MYVVLMKRQVFKILGFNCNMRCFIMFVTTVGVLFLLKLKWPKNKSVYDSCCFILAKPRCYFIKILTSALKRFNCLDKR